MQGKTGDELVLARQILLRKTSEFQRIDTSVKVIMELFINQEFDQELAQPMDIRLLRTFAQLLLQKEDRDRLEKLVQKMETMRSEWNQEDYALFIQMNKKLFDLTQNVSFLQKALSEVNALIASDAKNAQWLSEKISLLISCSLYDAASGSANISEAVQMILKNRDILGSSKVESLLTDIASRLSDQPSRNSFNDNVLKTFTGLGLISLSSSSPWPGLKVLSWKLCAWEWPGRMYKETGQLLSKWLRSWKPSGTRFLKPRITKK